MSWTGKTQNSTIHNSFIHQAREHPIFFEKGIKFIYFQDLGISYSTLTDKRKSEFRILSNLYIAPNQTIIHCRNTRKAGILSISSSKTLNPVHPRMNQKTYILKFEKFGQINTALYILDTCMHWIHTCVTRNTQNSYQIYINHAPSGHLKTTQEEFSESNCSCKNLNQFEPVLVSAESTKNLKFPTFNTNFTHF